MPTRREKTLYVNSAGQPSRFLVDLKYGDTCPAARDRGKPAAKIPAQEKAGKPLYSLFSRPKPAGPRAPKIDLLGALDNEPDQSLLLAPLPGAAWPGNWSAALKPAAVFFCLLLSLAAAFKSFAYYNRLKDVNGSILGALEGAVTIGRALGETAELKALADHTLGFGRDRRFLLVFQNNTELRASGGFIGSYAIIDLSGGRIARWEAPGGGSYDTTAGMRDFIKAPAPLRLVSPRWFFWDANWWPDWPKTADKLEWFLEHSDGPTVDGVIGLTPTVVERMLDVIGPVHVPEQDITVDSRNFWSEVQAIAEERPPLPPVASSSIATGSLAMASSTLAERHQPKLVIGQLMAALFAELPERLDRERSVALAGVLFRALEEEQLLLHFNDRAMQAIVRDFGWDGAQKAAAGDYLQVVHSNIAGGKTDKVVGEGISLVSRVKSDGTILNRLAVKRPHSGEPHTPLTGVRNVDWVRVYVPEGSRLLSSSGFAAPDAKWFEEPDPGWDDDPDVLASEGQARPREDGTLVYSENGKTVFANWLMVDPGMTGEIILEYELPFKYDPVSLPYTLLAEKQPGSLGSDLAAELYLSDNLVWSAQDKLVADRYYQIQNANLKMQIEYSK